MEAYQRDKVVYLAEPLLKKTWGQRMLDFVVRKNGRVACDRLKTEARISRICNRIHNEYKICIAQLEIHMEDYTRQVIKEELK